MVVVVVFITLILTVWSDWVGKIMVLVSAAGDLWILGDIYVCVEHTHTQTHTTVFVLWGVWESLKEIRLPLLKKT